MTYTQARTAEKPLAPAPAPYSCRYCGAQVQPGKFSADIDSQMRAEEACFTCSFWLDISRHQEIVTENHFHLVIQSEDVDKRCKGHGGRAFRVRFDDGREVRTTNLWINGRVPEHLRHLFTPNAKVGYAE